MANRPDKLPKTNALRALDRAQVSYRTHTYDTAQLDAVHAAKDIGVPCARLFKTLVTASPDGRHFVFLLPSDATLDTKRAARAAGVKDIAMIPQKELLPLTGYIHGGCSPLGMKKAFPTFVDESAAAFDTILFSAGHIGCMAELSPADLLRLTGASYAPLVLQEK